MGNKIVLIMALLMLSGCAARLISSNQRSVIVKAGSAQAASAQAMADKECAKYSRFAKLTLKSSPNDYVFDCVE